jgi:hypothetical protein
MSPRRKGNPPDGAGESYFGPLLEGIPDLAID